MDLPATISSDGSLRRSVSIQILQATLTLAMGMFSPAFGETSYEYRIAGALQAILHTIVTGEFAGRYLPGPDIRDAAPLCGPDDFREMREVVGNTGALLTLGKRCRVVEVRIEADQVVAISHVSGEYCEPLKQVFDALLSSRASHVSKREMTIEYKGSRLSASIGDLVRGAKIKSECRLEGSLQATAPRKR